MAVPKTVLAREPQSTFTLIYANRQTSSIMFREELEDLKNRPLSKSTLGFLRFYDHNARKHNDVGE